MAKIFLFRHGQTTYNRDKIFTGWGDPPLTDLGIEQAEYLHKLLEDTKLDLAYRSSLIRSKHTLEIVLEGHDECKEIIVDDRITERSYGELSGRKHQEIIDKFGQEQYNKWHRGWSDKPPGGESFEDVEIRVNSFLLAVKEKYKNGNKKIAISAHGNSIRLFRKILENLTIGETCGLTIPYDKYFEYEI